MAQRVLCASSFFSLFSEALPLLMHELVLRETVNKHLAGRHLPFNILFFREFLARVSKVNEFAGGTVGIRQHFCPF